jgi:hypothetical protein
VCEAKTWHAHLSSLLAFLEISGTKVRRTFGFAILAVATIEIH